MDSFSGSSRGGFAPRGGRGARGRGGRAPFLTKTRETNPDLEKHPLGCLIKEFGSPDLGLNPVDLAKISDCQYVASYNWLNDEVPTIVIPGKPPQWTPLQEPQRLKEDSGQYFRDPNAAMYPDYPMAPVVNAVLETDSEFDAARTDVFACGSTLGNLLRFARGIDKAFRFNVVVIGDTVFFMRKDNDPREVIKDVRGFGHTFPEAYTTWEHSVKGSETHQRIIRYKFGGFSCLVRFESDGYIPDSSAVTNTTPANTAVGQGDLFQAFQGATISQQPTINKLGSLKIKQGGSPVPQKSIFDLKTRSGKYKKDIDMSDILPQLWINQIPNFIVAYHDGRGLFEDIRVRDVSDDVQAWVTDNSDGIRRFATLLDKIVDIARSNSDKLLEVYCPGKEHLEVREQYGDGAHALPADLRDGLDGSKDGDGGDISDGDEYYDSDEYGFDNRSDDSSEELDYTACSAHDCGYCGKCTY
ncbi:hypothetical protein M011DRAFT_452333 [Sporormia fimetaria CBS 119925]|uniref:Geranylgeranyl pyrophosphate synthetase n=1 Tax=Sporormia fimetaria CBS 119925 TaxID=1340428 RepID=A0A6A6UYK6_9PLEO|nr:hypothetical protein M011DRAFT_452333 [Sporormia fimetaria CBS 119925]